MNRERALKVVLTIVGLLFSAAVYPMMMFIRREPALSMMLCIYATLGIFLLLAVRNPSANRSLIAFAAWSSFVHAGLMGVQASRHIISHGEWGGVALFAVIGVVLFALAPVKQTAQRAAAVAF